MKQLFLSVVISFSLWACAPKTEISSLNPDNKGSDLFERSDPLLF